MPESLKKGEANPLLSKVRKRKAAIKPRHPILVRESPRPCQRVYPLQKQKKPDLLVWENSKQEEQRSENQGVEQKDEGEKMFEQRKSPER